MIDYGKIGSRIKEERKYIHKLSQEKMAEELGMYQADISNLEKAKKGSGITDLDKLDLIAEYFGMSLQTLLFGGSENMPVYAGDTMVLKPEKKKIPKNHRKVLEKLINKDLDHVNITTFSCGPYSLYYAFEIIQITPLDNQMNNPIPKMHAHIFYRSELVAVMTAFMTTLMHHVFQPSFHQLKYVMETDVFNAENTMDILNPYWSLYTYYNDEADSENKEQIFHNMTQRMDQLKAKNPNRVIYYVDSLYVREDARQKGIMRMCIDLLKKITKNPMIWLNMLPAAEQHGSPVFQKTFYSASDIGQLHINAAIAEKLGFTIDTYVENIASTVINADGEPEIQAVKGHKIAYLLPEDISDIIDEESELTDYVRSMKQLGVLQYKEPAELGIHISEIDDWTVGEFRLDVFSELEKSGTIYCYAAQYKNLVSERKYVVSLISAFAAGVDQDDVLEYYDSLDEATFSDYYENLHLADSLLSEHLKYKK